MIINTLYTPPSVRVLEVHCGPIAQSYNKTDRTEILGRDSEEVDL